MTAREKYNELKASLAPALGAGEAEGAARILMEDLAGFDRRKLFTDGDRTLLGFTEGKLDAAVKNILAGEPVQYAVGRARFYGLDFKVSPAVLIPRPETEGLVDLVVDRMDGRSDLRGLDVCTGSGCIAVALARTLPFCRMDALELSPEALEVAEENVKTLAPATVTVFRDDALLIKGLPAASYDFIVSNPPYVLPSEARDMDARVLEKEPGMALFVPENDPLLFYRAISAYAFGALKAGGMLFFEINSTQGEAMRRLLSEEGFEAASIEILRDYKGNIRYALARKQ